MVITVFYKIYAVDPYIYVEKHNNLTGEITKVYEPYYLLDHDDNRYIDSDIVKVHTNVSGLDIREGIVVVFKQNAYYQYGNLSNTKYYVNTGDSLVIPYSGYTTNEDIFITPN